MACMFSLTLFKMIQQKNEKEKNPSVQGGFKKNICICEYIIIEFYLVFCCILLIYNAIRFIQYLFYSILHFPSCLKLEFIYETILL